MAIVIDALALVSNNKRLPTEAFFVDTNVVIDFEDTFGRSLEKPALARRNAETTEVIKRLKSAGFQSLSTTSVALEYYKFIQVGFYLVHTGKQKFDTDDFKHLRANDIAFIDRWDSQISTFKKLFSKKFPIYQSAVMLPDLLASFRGSEVDFGDHLLWKIVQSAPAAHRCVFSGDSDFYSFPDDVFLLTINKRVIESANRDGKLFAPDVN